MFELMMIGWSPLNQEKERAVLLPTSRAVQCHHMDSDSLAIIDEGSWVNWMSPTTAGEAMSKVINKVQVKYTILSKY